MNTIIKFLILFIFIFVKVSSDTYSVKISTQRHVNVVDSRFLSFTVDPKYLFANSEKYNSKESTCMASSLTPAYIRIAGPSTAHLTFTNTTITFTDLDSHKELQKPKKKFKKLSFESLSKQLAKNFSPEDLSVENPLHSKKEDFESSSKEQKRIKKNLDYENSNEEKELEVSKERFENSKKDELKLEVTHSQWKQFVHWAKSSGFDLVFALNNEDKNEGGVWDANSALNVLSMADKANVSEIFWQLGYECTNQSVDEYLNDLETLRVMVETFPSSWRTVGGDISKCLQADSKSDFIDYVTLTEDMMDAVLLNGNSSSQELEKMSESDRVKLLKLLSRSKTPLWLTESHHGKFSELYRAADWMTSLGYSAKNGFSVHFRELAEEELFEPTLSFYMALLFKNLVGERVLNVDMDASEAVLFAHCTSLRHKPVPGAVTLYAANLDTVPARFSIKLGRREEGGDIMQFILSHDSNGNIVVNGRAMYHEGDIRPVVKRVRPYKTLLVNLPPKSFGFWVLANTKVDACHEVGDDDVIKKELEGIPVEDVALENTVKTKRSMLSKSLDIDALNSKELNEETDRRFLIGNEGLKKRVKDLNVELENVNKIFNKSKRELSRRKRETSNEELGEVKRKFRHLKHKFEKKWEEKPKLESLRKLLTIKHADGIKGVKNKIRSRMSSRVTKRSHKYDGDDSLDTKFLENEIQSNKLSRRRRSVEENEHHKKHKREEISAENEIDSEINEAKLWKILNKIHNQIKDIEVEEDKDISLDNEESKDDDEITVKTKLSDDKATVKYSEKSKHGLLKTTVDKVVTVLGDLNHNLNRFWDAFSLLE